MSTGFQVQPDALDRYASALEQAGQRISQLMSSLGSVDVPEDAFGKLPDSHGLAASYQEHHDADVQNLADLAQLLSETAEGLTGTADSYRTLDAELAGAMGGIPA
ncbi:type VII secretion target [Kitasatospora sp. NPDC094015]|uniref:WXG100 family type VII secretion target n=1 Tax=Kitasatospora sp. NPDC094015 TaxID=3155205 RepID=UPI003316F90D